MLTIISILLLICTLYLLIFAVASRFEHTEKTIEVNTTSIENLRTLFMIPVYKEDEVILDTVANIRQQNDLSATDDILVIADSLKKETIQELEEKQCWVVEVKKEKRSKSNAINTALKSLEIWGVSYDNVVLLDADNHIGEGFITDTKIAYASGMQIVQCHRVAKNSENSMAKWDAISEEINNSIFRKGHRILGLSSALIGSGLSMDFELFKKFMRKIEVFSGFDKQLELDILEQKYTIHYLENVLVYDEKVRNKDVFKSQRTRWIAAQINFAKSNGFKAFKELFVNRNFDFFEKYLQFVMPPRMLLLVAHLVFIPFSFLNFSASILSMLSLVSLISALMLATPRHLFKEINLGLLVKIPELAKGFLSAVFKINEAKGKFIHTPHHN